MPSAEEIRAGQRATWAGLSPSWEKWDDVITSQLSPVGDAILERLGITGTSHHLDIASGTGEPGLSVARRAPRGHVVLTDLAPEMIDIAMRRASAEGITNIEAHVCSADALPFADATFDSVSVRFGYMFFPDEAKATAEFARVLKPGGRLCSSVWVRPDANPWTAIAMEAIATEIVLAPSAPSAPHMFRFQSPGQIGTVYADAGFHEIAEWDVAIQLVVRSPAEYWEMISEHVSLVALALQGVDGAARNRIRSRALEGVGQFQEGDTVRVPGVARCIVGTKPGERGGEGSAGAGPL